VSYYTAMNADGGVWQTNAMRAKRPTDVLRDVESRDTLTSVERSRLMASIRTRDTAPEVAVRKVLHARGFRFRLHQRSLPGSPDVVLARYHIAVFVHGCFWHQHPGCRKATIPAANHSFWDEKLTRNRERDARQARELRRLGWRPVVVWECEVCSAQGRWMQRVLSAIRASTLRSRAKVPAAAS
jgi:DNA mismatch endonuclease (patch repair protein)